MTHVLATDRLRLRELSLADTDGLLAIFSDPEAMRYYPSTKDRAATEGWIHWCLKSYQQNGFGLWAIVRLADEVFLGDCGLMLQPMEDRLVPEIGYHLLPGEWGRGYATEAARACRDWLFRETTYQEAISIVDPANRRSRAVAERVHARMRMVRWGSDRRAMCLYSITRADLDAPAPAANARDSAAARTRRSANAAAANAADPAYAGNAADAEAANAADPADAGEV